MEAVAAFFLIFFGVCCCICFVVQFLCFTRLQKKPPNRPDEYLKIQSLRGDHAKKVVYMLGDSHFHGRFGFDVVGLLNGWKMEQSKAYNPEGQSPEQEALVQEADVSEQYEIVNDGVNGRTTTQGLKQLPTLVACRPDAVVVLLGTNDIFRAHSDAGRQEASLQVVNNMESLVDGIRWGVPNCRIAIVSLPIIGEQMDTAVNQGIVATNAQLKDLCERKSCALLPLNESQAAVIGARMEMRQSGDGEMKAPLVRPRHPGIMMMLGTAWAKVMLHKTCAEVSTNNGLTVTTDCVHLNDIAGIRLAVLIARFLRS